MDPLEAVNEIAKACDGTIKEVSILPDGSGFATMSMPLRPDHWIYGLEFGDQYEAPPMVLKMGAQERIHIGFSSSPAGIPLDSYSVETYTKEQIAEKIREAGKYAVRSATMKGKEMDFDPDAFLQNLVVAFLGYWTEDGLSAEQWCNPPRHRK